MHSPLIAVVICVFTQVAAAQSITPPTAAAAPVHASAVQAAATSPARPAPAPAPAHGGELIKAAAAGTRDDMPPVAHAAAVRSPHDEEHPHHGSTAMLLAALALMSGIALRRFGGPRE